MQFTQGKNKKLKHLQYQCFSLWGFNKYVQIQYLNTNQTWLNYSSVVEILQMHQSHERRRFVVKHDPKHREGQGSASHLHKLLRRSEAADTQRYEDPAASVTAFRGILGQLLTDLTVDLISERNNSWSLQALLCTWYHISISASWPQAWPKDAVADDEVQLLQVGCGSVLQHAVSMDCVFTIVQTLRHLPNKKERKVL